MKMDEQFTTPRLRIRTIGSGQVRSDGGYVLYWMTAARRLTWNFGLQHAVDRARDLGKPLLVLEALRCDYPWASDRLHAFVLKGMAEHAVRAPGLPISYFPYVEAEKGAGRGLLATLAGESCAVVTDDFPAFFHPRMLRAASCIPVLLEAVDSNGILPMRAAERVFTTAYAFRRFLQSELPHHLEQLPRADPVEGVELKRLDQLPSTVTRQWPQAGIDSLVNPDKTLRRLPIDHNVSAVGYRGGNDAAQERLVTFIDEDLDGYAGNRMVLVEEGTSRLSPYLHFGHVSSHQIVDRILTREGWDRTLLGPQADGRRSGWWGLSESVESFLDQLITWRELGFNMCCQRQDFEEFESLPDWALKTLGEHAGDPRPHLYTLQELESAATHDPLWNAAQVQLLREGRIHNYLRMLWGKKILEWTESPMLALEVMIELNNKYAVDGRDPNSTSGIFWILGRYDRAWGPERPIFGKVRYMSSENTARKMKTHDYLDKYSS